MALLERGCNMFYTLYLKLINLIHKWHWSTAASHMTPSRLPPELIDEILQFTSSEQITQLCKSEYNILASLAKYRMRHRKANPANAQKDDASDKMVKLRNELAESHNKEMEKGMAKLRNELAESHNKEMAKLRTEMAEAIAEAIRMERMEKSTSSTSSPQPTANAWVTLATTDGYAVGALVLAHSLRKVSTAHKLHVMFTAGVSAELIAQLREVFDQANMVNVLDGDVENFPLIGRPNLHATFTKLHCWLLPQYTKCVFLDADRFVVQNCDELFDRPEFSAIPYIGWPDCFNTGVFVFVPSMDTYRSLLQFSLSNGSFDFGVQRLLNAYFRESDASHSLPFVYNVTTGAIHCYAAALKKFAPQVKIIQFEGKQKPCLQHYERGSTEGMTFVSQYHQWCAVYNQLVQQHLPTTAMVSDQYSAQQHANERLSSFSHLTERPFSIGAPSTSSKSMGLGRSNADADSSENMQKALEKSLQEQ